ncbi:uncharacterized protein LOC100846782 [Brachypodium distachyon]|uniref:uncharacterized protein LOC100846782 n=1 Tax=Brachypodium distachyon TaxID=15368 RepID=UPI00052FFB72|nr:uncharacterized protein LOC100846782 [Brachypodium distachyon]|eukprot:XP_003562254.2 uncharacterized protein LOC100846782 [Brachypodium distachyon]
MRLEAYRFSELLRGVGCHPCSERQPEGPSVRDSQHAAKAGSMHGDAGGVAEIHQARGTLEDDDGLQWKLARKGTCSCAATTKSTSFFTGDSCQDFSNPFVYVG